MNGNNHTDTTAQQNYTHTIPCEWYWSVLSRPVLWPCGPLYQTAPPILSWNPQTSACLSTVALVSPGFFPWNLLSQPTPIFESSHWCLWTVLAPPPKNTNLTSYPNSLPSIMLLCATEAAGIETFSRVSCLRASRRINPIDAIDVAMGWIVLFNGGTPRAMCWFHSLIQVLEVYWDIGIHQTSKNIFFTLL